MLTSSSPKLQTGSDAPHSHCHSDCPVGQRKNTPMESGDAAQHQQQRQHVFSIHQLPARDGSVSAYASNCESWSSEKN